MKLKLRQWLSDRCFQFVHGRHLVYNTCWEDPAVDRVALNLGPSDTVLVITSAGCNALDYVLAGAGQVYAVDVNYRQNALLELKQAAIRHLGYDDFFRLFGRGKHPQVREVYHDVLRPNLPTWTWRFWDKRYSYFRGQGWRGSFYFRGTAGTFARLINTYIDRVAKVRPEIDALLAADSVAEQEVIYHGRLRPRFWRRFLRWAVRRDATLSLLGVPRPQRLQVERYYPGGIVRFIEDSLSTVFARLPLKDNYFWRVYLTGEYTPECCPEYLKRDNYARLKAGLVECITAHSSSVTRFLRQNEITFSRFVLLDHMDWIASTQPLMLRDEWQAILDRAAPGGRIIYRSGGLRAEYVEPLQVQVGGRTWRLGDLLRFHPELAHRLHARDRVHTYGSFYIADLP